ncbi:MAG TPA: VOC family protein [Euzebya sp.]|nr:VOC family protein [Euzebya sp.]
MSQPTHLSAVTLSVTDMARAVAFYDAMGFQLHHGGADADFTSYRVGEGYLNLQQVPQPPATDWGRAILYVTDVDAAHSRAVEAGYSPAFAPRDAPWGERYFHLRDPEGHELSFARPLDN